MWQMPPDIAVGETPEDCRVRVARVEARGLRKRLERIERYAREAKRLKAPLSPEQVLHIINE